MPQGDMYDATHVTPSCRLPPAGGKLNWKNRSTVALITTRATTPYCVLKWINPQCYRHISLPQLADEKTRGRAWFAWPNTHTRSEMPFPLQNPKALFLMLPRVSEDGLTRTSNLYTNCKPTRTAFVWIIFLDPTMEVSWGRGARL